MVLFTAEFKVSHSLRKVLSASTHGAGLPISVRCDHQFEQVMRACAAPRPGQDGTWISQTMIDAYLELHRLGIAHSVETWIEGHLAGGLYGLSIGRMFYGESMFTRQSNASKIALAALVQFLRQHEFPMIDCQQQTTHLASLGARPIPRQQFVGILEGLVDAPGIVKWPEQLPLGSFATPSTDHAA
jgi:leucyl/phenylalanyl-tRNA--protein transferase